MLLLAVIALSFILIHNYLNLLYFRRVLPAKREHWGYYAISITLNLGIGVISSVFNLYNIGIFMFTAAMVVSFYLLFQVSRLQIFFMASLYFFLIDTSRGILVSIYVILYGDSINNIMRPAISYHTLLGLSVLTSALLYLLLGRRITPASKMKQLVNNQEQLKLVVIYLFILLTYIRFINTGHFMEIRLSWFSVLYGLSCIISKLGLYFVLHHTIRVSSLLEYEWYSRQLQEQLERQIQHYHAYQNFIEGFRSFKHDYKSLMGSVKLLLQNQETEKAIKLIDEIQDTMQRNILEYKMYSDHVLLDAMLQDAANFCEQNHISFSALLPMPERIGLKDMDAVRVFSNLFKNAIEACSKLPDRSKRFVKITGHTSPDWVYVEVMNSFHGEIKTRHGKLRTTKPDKDSHGVGLRNVTEIIEGLGGMLLIDIDQKKEIFTVRLHIPRMAED
ncbi:GHKL domain-containing protein [Paenibacillus motobuensis]|uniref:sensor histidine kinase n=1 Tax=Paenibacillus TaxID=44249 RepID=UPI0020402608|nr:MULTISPECIES: GHKL domain-containing protein [Paenibacillus]MCM3042285.1 GHKL domain-containing protein [Paenibacillus lutimineralis]MCM3649389.1 GHKL domain-containing protein [Paenibacillus motobuensis]